MSWPVGRQRVLSDIGRNLAGSDPRLHELFSAFNERASGGKMPRTERIRTGPLGFISRIGCRIRPESADPDRMSAWWL